MLDFYNATYKHPALVFDDHAPKKILFKGTAKECMEYILVREPENPVKRDYIRNYKQHTADLSAKRGGGMDMNIKNLFFDICDTVMMLFILVSEDV